jgi:diadenosine tetraphosphate (Ap4A) HIT family hydrolase
MDYNKYNHSNADFCRFCHPPDKSRILFETKHFYVMLSLGPIAEGYLLINSKLHFDCCGAFLGDVAKEFDQVVTEVQKIQIQVYGECIFFEHGRAGSCLQYSEPSTHCFHAHMHCVPISVNLNDKISNTQNPIYLSSFQHFREVYQKNENPYLFVSDAEMKIHFIKADIRKQYLRYLLSTQLGSEELWDWVSYQRWDIINMAQQKLRPYFDLL